MSRWDSRIATQANRFTKLMSTAKETVPIRIYLEIVRLNRPYTPAMTSARAIRPKPYQTVAGTSQKVIDANQAFANAQSKMKPK